MSAESCACGGVYHHRMSALGISTHGRLLAFLLACIIAGSAIADDKIRVGVSVDSGDDKLESFVSSLIRSELRRLGDVDVVDAGEESYQFGVHVQVDMVAADTFVMAIVTTWEFRCGSPDYEVSDYQHMQLVDAPPTKMRSRRSSAQLRTSTRGLSNLLARYCGE